MKIKAIGWERSQIHHPQDPRWQVRVRLSDGSVVVDGVRDTKEAAERQAQGIAANGCEYGRGNR